MRGEPIKYEIGERVDTEFGPGIIENVQLISTQNSKRGKKYCIKLDDNKQKLNPWLGIGMIKKIKVQNE